jgi:hypothetical protein
MSLILNDYECPTDHGIFEALMDSNGPDCAPCPVCSKPSIRLMPAPMGRVKIGEVVRGGVDKPDSPMYLNTRELGEGMPYDDWRAKRDKMYDERRFAESKKF